MAFLARNTNNAATKFGDITCIADETQANSTQKGSLLFKTNLNASTAERMRIHHNGYVGIGITTSTMLDVGGTGTFRASNTTSYQLFSMLLTLLLLIYKFG